MTEPSRIRVLVVDDDMDLLRAYRRILAASGFAVETAVGGEAALERLACASYDVVVSDIHMPFLDGIGLLREVRRDHRGIPFIFITGDPQLDTAVEALEGRALHYLSKPVASADLARLVREAAGAEAREREAETLCERRALEARLDRALDGLWMAFQPIVSVRERRVVAYEALCRTDEPSFGSPGELLEVAERLGRVHDLGRVIRRRACARLAEMPSGVDLFLNLHPDELTDDDLLDQDGPIAPLARRIVLEVTERRALEAVSGVAERVDALKRAGYRIAVDDLGAGYAGLASFAHLEPAVVKLDMSLVRDVDRLPVKQRLVRTMVELGQAIGAAVVVEGVETEAERKTLEACGCDLMQGYLFARPARDLALPSL